MRPEDVVERVLTDTAVSRRSFLKWSAALGGTAAFAGGSENRDQWHAPVSCAPLLRLPGHARNRLGRSPHTSIDFNTRVCRHCNFATSHAVCL